MVDFINEILPQIETLASSEEENGSSNGHSASNSKEDSPIPMDLGTNGINSKIQPPFPPEVMMRMPPPEMMMGGPQGPGGFRPPPPEMMIRMMGPQGAMRPPPPEILAKMAAATGPRGNLFMKLFEGFHCCFLLLKFMLYVQL